MCDKHLLKVLIFSFRKVHGLEAEIEKWKMDYVTLIQSSIRFPGQEQGTEELELSLYGGDKVGDYVTLIQSSIRFPGQEQGTEELELSLYGGDKVGDL